MIASLLTILEQYPPLTSRLRCQVAFLKECLSHNSVKRYISTRGNKYLLQEVLLQKLNCSFILPSYFDGWLSGFVEAEGSFVIRSKGSASFAIGQNNDRYLLEAINTKFGGVNKVIKKTKVF